MKSVIIASTLMGAALAAPQAVSPRAGCSDSFDGTFEITVADVTVTKRDLQKRACGTDGTLLMTLKDGITYDSQLRTGYIASNYQFQFDAPPQSNALVTSGFAVCENNLLSLGDSQTFYRCLSGTFYNLYNTNWAPQCEAVSIIALPCGSDAAVSQGADGQVVGTTIVQTTIVTALSDGQPQVITTAVPVTIYTTYPATTTVAPVSQISDGQVQAPPPTSGAAGTTIVVPTETGATSVAATTAPAATGATTAVASGSTTKAAVTSSAKVSSTAASTTSAAPSTTSAPAQGGSTRVAAGSVGALIVGMVAAFVFA
jgi:hypothetical protein